MKGHFSFFLCSIAAIAALLSSACSRLGQPSGRTESARGQLILFFNYLSTGAYTQAADLFGGDYQPLRDFNPDIDPADLSTLWQIGCQHNGLQCLPVRSAVLNKADGGVYTFTVEFMRPDGSTFILGPCCGATSTEMPPISRFEIRVQEVSPGNYLVIDLPPYMP